MFKRAIGNAARPHASSCFRNRAFHSAGSSRSLGSSISGLRQGKRGAVALASAALIGSVVFYVNVKEIHNDALEEKNRTTMDLGIISAPNVNDQETLHSLVWGSNRCKVLLPTAQLEDSVRNPAVANWLDGVALRDLQLHERYAACVDARGDVYQWGDAYFGDVLPSGESRSPKLTLRGKNIVQLQLTEDKLYALSASGHIYVIASKALDEVLPTGNPTPASDSWWGTGWLWGEDETIDFAQLQPNEKLAWGEKFTSIAAGKNHLISQTSKGRAFGHPVSKLANRYGQLGFQKFWIPDPASHITGQNTHLHVDLVPKSLTDPFEGASRSVRAASAAIPAEDLTSVNDRSIRFCPSIYEIPSLRGVEVAQIAAGSRSSFVRTTTGRVLGWGANEYGQLGLGSNVSLDTITVPTEVVLWRTVPNSTKTVCSDVTAGGDLTAFTVDRSSETERPYTDLLMSGNGQYGGLGNNAFTTAQSSPARVKAVSGLRQYNDSTKELDPIRPDDIAISPTGHVLLALNSAADSGGVGGSDVMVWGRNFDSELGNGKRSSTASPVTLQIPEGERFMLLERQAGEVKDLHGRLWKRGVKVEQRMVAGFGNSVIYWKIV